MQIIPNEKIEKLRNVVLAWLAEKSFIKKHGEGKE